MDMQHGHCIHQQCEQERAQCSSNHASFATRQTEAAKHGGGNGICFIVHSGAGEHRVCTAKVDNRTQTNDNAAEHVGDCFNFVHLQAGEQGAAFVAADSI